MKKQPYQYSLFRTELIMYGFAVVCLIAIVFGFVTHYKKVVPMTDNLNDYDHIDVTVTEVVTCYDVEEATNLNNETFNEYYYLVKLSDNDNLVVYKSSVSANKLEQQLPMRINGNVFNLKGDEYTKAVEAYNKAQLNDYGFYPYLIQENHYFNVSLIVLLGVILFIAIVCHIIRKNTY